MNAIVGFRQCSLTNEQLAKKIDNLTDEIYKTGKIPERNIPARPDSDYDLLVGEMVVRFLEFENNSGVKIESLEGLLSECLLNLAKDTNLSLIADIKKILNYKG